MSGKIIDVSDGLNYNESYTAYNPSMEVYKDELYCIWCELGDSRQQIKMKKYNGTSWINISNNLNYGNGGAEYPSMQVYKDELYCAWCERISDKNSTHQIRIKKHNGNIWSNVSSSLNFNGNRYAWSPSMQVYKNELYCVWRESNDNNSNDQIKVKKYNGSSWINVSSNLNYNENKHAAMPKLCIYKDELYCVWNEYNDKGSNRQIKIKKYDGTNWSNVSSNLNYNENNDAYEAKLQAYKDELYCTWDEGEGADYHARIKKYDGISWTEISYSLDYNENNNSLQPNFQVYKDELYYVWSGKNSDTGSNRQIKIKKYDGTNWNNVSSNLNYNENNDVYNPNMQVYRDELYCVWRERNDNSKDQVKIKKYVSTIEKIQKYLIKHNDKYFKINDDGQIVQIESNDFGINGFDNINLITRELLKSKFDNLDNLQILMWTNDIEKNEATMTCELRNPYRPIDILKKNNNGICNILFKEL